MREVWVKREKRYRAVYKGVGFVPGVPARDLCEAEVERYGVTELRRGRIWDIVEILEEKPGDMGAVGETDGRE